MEKNLMVGIVLLSSAALTFAISLMLDGLVATVLLCVAAADGLIGLVLMMKGLQRNSESTVQMPADPPHVVLDRLRRTNPAVLTAMPSDPGAAAEIVGLIQGRQKIAAIKRIRELTSSDLTSAKQMADRLESAIANR